jgi:small conductance mechanosensitive channel
VGLLRVAAAGLGEDPRWQDDLIEAPEVLGVEQITVDGAVLRTTVKTSSEEQWRVGRELRRRLTEALAVAGISTPLVAGRVYVRPASPEPGTAATPATPAPPTPVPTPPSPPVPGQDPAGGTGTSRP